MSLDDLKSLSISLIKAKNHSYKRYLFRRKPFKHRFSILIGPRGVGKTTTLIQHLCEQVDQSIVDPRILYVQSDHFLMGNYSLYELADHFQMEGGKWLAIDEVHKFPGWSGELKSIYDTFPHLHIVASGSSALEIFKGTHDLSRRAIVHQMEGMSFREYLELKLGLELESYSLEQIVTDHVQIAHDLVDQLEKVATKPILDFKNYLKGGYFPYYQELPDLANYLITLEQNIHTTIESDLVAIYPQLSGNTVVKLKQLLSFLASSVPFAPNWEKLRQTLEIGDPRTLRSYFYYLENAGLIRSLPKASKKMSRIDSPAKVYLHNPNLLQAISSGRSLNQGTIRETFLLAMLQESQLVSLPSEGDFQVGDSLVIEVGGEKKGWKQVKHLSHACLACDDSETGSGRKIPLWLFGFLY